MGHFDGKSLKLQELLQIQTQVLAELKSREIVRGNNAPIGDVAEYLVLQARGGTLESNSTKSHDITDPSNLKIQVKARAISQKQIRQKFSAFRSFDFDVTIFVVFDPDTYRITWAREVSADEIRQNSYWQGHTNSYTITAAKVQGLGSDVTNEIVSAYEKL